MEEWIVDVNKMASKQTTVVLGAGILGVATAAYLSAEDRNDVVLVSDGEPGGGVSDWSFSWVNATGNYSGAYSRLRREGIELYHKLAVSWPGHPKVSMCGGLYWDDDSGSLFRTLKEAGYSVEWLNKESVLCRAPELAEYSIPDSGAMLSPREGWVDLPSLMDYLIGVFKSRGGRLVISEGSAHVEVRDSQVQSVTPVGSTAIPTNQVIVSCGASVPMLAYRDTGYSIPDGNVGALRIRARAPMSTPEWVLNTPDLEIRPNGEGEVVIGTKRSDLITEAEDSARAEEDDGPIRQILDDSSRVFKSGARLGVISYRTGTKPVPSDGEPVIGPIEGVQGYYVVYTHSGATLALVLGKTIASEISGNAQQPLLEPFRPSRVGSYTHA